MKQILIALLLIVSIGAAHARPDIYIHTMHKEITPGYFQRIIISLDKAKPGDLVTLDISSPGGSLNEAKLLVIAMANTKAFIACKVRSAGSAAAFLMMLCHEKIMGPRGLVLFHFSSVAGNLNPSVPKYIDPLTQPIELLTYISLKQFYIDIGIKDLMTDEEWALMNEGEDIVFTTEEFARRCTASKTCTLSIR